MSFRFSIPLAFLLLIGVPLPGFAAAVVSGGTHSGFVADDGQIWLWGDNAVGQFGNGTLVSASAPVRVPEWGVVRQLSVSSGLTLALRTDGTVWAAGEGDAGQLGEGKTTDRAAPVQAVGLANVIAVAAAPTAAYALRADGSVWAWGANTRGELGDGTLNARSRPTRVSTLAGVTALAAGTEHALALTSDGRVWRWGNAWGGSGHAAVPTAVPGLAGIVQIAAGDQASFALDQTGRVWAWGSNDDGQLGDGGTGGRFSPALVPDLPPIRRIAAGNRGAVMALGVSGGLHVWGRNTDGQARPGAAARLPTPQPFAAVPPFVDLAPGGVAAALGDDGVIRTWGGSVGRQGSGSPVLGSAPVPLLMQPGFAQLALGDEHGLLLDAGGKVWSFGANTRGQRGDPVPAPRAAPGMVAGLSGVAEIKAGFGVSGARTSAGALWLWGDNAHGQLGRAAGGSSGIPSAVAGLANLQGFDLGLRHGLAVNQAGEVFGWGSNVDGGLALAAPLGAVVLPTKLPALPAVGAVATGTTHSLALLPNGTVLQWGDGSPTPATVPRVAGVKQIAAGRGFSVALLHGGTLLAWGRNDLGQLGDGSTSERPRPSQVSGLQAIVAISVHGDHALALQGDGTVWRWGSGQRTPAAVAPGFASTAAAAGGFVDGVLRPAGRAWILDATPSPGWVADNAPALRAAVQVVADLRAGVSAADADADALPDAWEQLHFGTTGNRAGSDADGDGLSNAQELALGTSPVLPDTDGDGFPDWQDPYPTDYYNGEAPTLALLAGADQVALPGAFNPVAFDVAVWNRLGTAPLVSAPVVFSVQSGGGRLALAPDPSTPVSSTLQVRTDADGTAQVYFQQPATPGITSQIAITAGAAALVVQSRSGQPTPGDADGDGLVDTWELQYFGSLASDAEDDPDGDGVTNLREHQLGRNPTKPAIPDVNGTVNLVLDWPR